MNYRREMRMLAPLAGVILVLAGCAAEENTPLPTSGILGAEGYDSTPVALYPTLVASLLGQAV